MAKASIHINKIFGQLFILSLLSIILISGQMRYYHFDTSKITFADKKTNNKSESESDRSENLPISYLEAFSFEAVVPFAKVQIDLLPYNIFKPIIVRIERIVYAPSNAPPLPSYFSKTFGHIIATNAP